MIDLPPIVGDPGTIKAFADYLRGLADQLDGVRAEIVRTPKSMTFEGPAADDFAERMQSLGSRIEGAADRLRTVAARVDAAAAEVESRIRARERLLAELRERHAAAVGGQ